MFINGPQLGRAAQCEPILRALPDWFGIEEAIVNYVRAIDELPTFLAHDTRNITFSQGVPHSDVLKNMRITAASDSMTMPQPNDPAIGFMSVKRHFLHAAELYVLAVRSEHHRRGVGRALLHAVEAWLRHENVRFLQVKTVSAAGNSPEYDETRKFYQATGFVPLEEFPTLWNPRNPACTQARGSRSSSSRS